MKRKPDLHSSCSVTAQTKKRFVPPVSKTNYQDSQRSVLPKATTSPPVQQAEQKSKQSPLLQKEASKKHSRSSAPLQREVSNEPLLLPVVSYNNYLPASLSIGFDLQTHLDLVDSNLVQLEKCLQSIPTIIENGADVHVSDFIGVLTKHQQLAFMLRNKIISINSYEPKLTDIVILLRNEAVDVDMLCIFQSMVQ